MRYFYLAAMFCFTGSVVTAQSVRWSPPGGTIPIERQSKLQLIFENCRPEREPEIPEVDGLILLRRGTSTQVNIVNFDIERTTIHEFAIRPTRLGKMTIPAITIRTNEGEMTLDPIEFEAVQSGRSSGPAPSSPSPPSGSPGSGTDAEAADFIILRLTVEDGELWEGEVADVEYEIKGWQQVFEGVKSSPEWNSGPLRFEGWDEKISEFSENLDGRNYIGGRYTGKVLAEEPGTHDIEPVRQVVAWRSGRSGIATFDRLLGVSRPQEMQSNPLRLRVKPLPEGAPDSFSGGVGDFQVRQEVVPQDGVRVGEPVTWTVEIEGEGNWTQGVRMPDRSIAQQFRVISPQSKMEYAEGTQLAGTLVEDMVLIPSEPGTYQLGPLKWSYFDPEAGEYRGVETEAVTIEVAAALPSSGGGVPAPTPGPGSGRGPSPSPAARAPAVAPEGVLIPRGWLPGRLSGGAPLAVAPFLIGTLLPVPLLLLAWFVLALRHAPRTDADRDRREAAKALAVLLGTTGTEVPGESLREWRSLVCRLWAVPAPVPTRSDLEEAVRSHPEKANPEAWGQLWEEAEAHLYRPVGRLPSDWLDRARELAQSTRVKRPPWWHAFLPRNLTAASAAVLFFLSMAAVAPADEVEAAYRSGDYADVEASLRTALVERPGDGVLRNNLGLAILQQERPAEAMGWFLSAWLHCPSHPDLAWNLEVASNRAESGLPMPEPGSVSSWLPAAHWQVVLIGASWTLAAGLGLVLVGAFQRRRRGVVATGAGLAGLGLIVLGGAWFGWSGYGLLADRDAALIVAPVQVRSIPSEVSDQIAIDVPPGLPVRVTDDFLTWRHIEFESGPSGWVRKSALVPLYRAEP